MRFKQPKDIDYRSVFVNKICKLLLIKHNFNYDAALNELNEVPKKDDLSLLGNINENVRNVYQFHGSDGFEIPLLTLNDVKQHTEESFMEEIGEWLDKPETKEEAIESIMKACKLYYESPRE